MSHNAFEHYTGVFYDVLVKQGSDPERNESSVKGTNPEQYPSTVEVKSEQHKLLTDAAYQQYIEGRKEMLKDLFPIMGSASSTAKADVSRALSQGSAGKFESNSPMLEGAAVDPLKEAQFNFEDGLLG
jgi:hypothetical protein